MSRNGNEIYAPPPNTEAVTGEKISSAKFNAVVADLTADANLARPILAGGTGATNAATARSSLGLEVGVDIASQGDVDDLSESVEGGFQVAGGLSSLADIVAQTIPAVVQYVVVIERAVGTGKLSGGRWFRSASEPDVPSLAKVQDASGTWFQLDTSGATIRPEQLGGGAYAKVQTETKAWYDACATKPNYHTLKEVDRLVLRLKLHGIWDRINGGWLFGGHDAADGNINLKDPATFTATQNGGLTFAAGQGLTGDGTSGYISFSAINAMMPLQNDSSVTISSVVTNPAEKGNIISTALGTSHGVSINPFSHSSGNFYAKMHGSNSVSVSVTGKREHRNGVCTVNRTAADNLEIAADGQLYKIEAETSSAPSTEAMTALRSATDYLTDTVRAVFVGQSLDALQLHQLHIFLEDFHAKIGAAINSDTTVEMAGGFVATVTPAENLAAFSAAVEIANKHNMDLRLAHGTYSSADTFPVAGKVVYIGAGRRTTELTLDAAVSAESPVVSPSHFDGGEAGWRLQDLTIYGAAMERGIADVGVQRPGGSGVNTLGSIGASLVRIDIVDPALHGADDCATPETGEDGKSYYSANPKPNKWNVGVRPQNTFMQTVLVECCGDDPVTMHGSDNFRGYDLTALYTSGRHPEGKRVSIGVEADDATRGAKVDGLTVYGLARAASAKSHDDNPAAANCEFRNVKARMCAQGVFLDDPNQTGGGRHVIDGLDFALPYQVAGDIDVNAIYVSGAVDCTLLNSSISGAAVHAVALGAAMKFGTGCKRVRTQNYSIMDWANSSGDDDDATYFVSSTVEHHASANGYIDGAGAVGIWDNGSKDPDYSNIYINGTGVGAQGNGVAGLTHRAIKYGPDLTTNAIGNFL